MAAKHTAPRQATLFDWVLLALIVALGGSAFVMIRSALETMPPAAITIGRLWLGAIVLYAIMVHAGRRLPPLTVRVGGKLRLRRSWGWMIAVGIVGNTLPFFIFPWAQQFVDSGLAGVYMAFMPIWTIALAFFFAGESLTGRKLMGFGLGFIGVVVLMGPEVLSGAADADLLAQAALLLATLCYAASVVLARRAPPIRPRVFAAGMMLVGAITATPALLFVSLDASQWSLASIASVAGLGVFPTGVNGVLIIMVIRRAGAGFMALTNYFTPIWAVAMGAAIYHERIEAGAFIALAIILIGVAISQRKQNTNPGQTNI
jgi:drug/metabolite transporter (DMT)-like permease